MKKLTSVYEENREVHKSLSTARLALHADEAIKNIFGNTAITKFELYQQLHTAIPYLKHVVHNHVKQSWNFIFKEGIDIEIRMERKTE
ncbi:hypothetical protein PHABIO_452 [Pseudomonas phage Phabio]|uniref:Uncharacterized protein n=1 Tax=Pseudomonas phage Phabio TaxID=2006668 RepID=A0A1Y0SU89_9CAUD|nr:hypothetical protein MZD05_gp466 [Pseudomonas phage Phabio]ARV77081.1 hypothetical protein PHABIO_452 [Pseudomonas phage Phabio]